MYKIYQTTVDRYEQNALFQKMEMPPILTPLRMTTTTVIFRFNTTPPMILKRADWTECPDLNEDTLAIHLEHPNIVKTYHALRATWPLPSPIKAARAAKAVFPADATPKAEEKPKTLETHIWLFMEELNVIVSPRRIGGDERVIRHIMRDILQALVFIHKQKIAHLDIKADNIMGFQDINGAVTYKLIDFGRARRVTDEGFVFLPRKNHGTFPYKPPEIIQRSVHALASDIWSLGATAWFLSLQRLPFYFSRAEKDLAGYRRFLCEPGPGEPDNHRFFYLPETSQALRAFVETCMQVDFQKRPTAEELLSHPFLQE